MTTVVVVFGSTPCEEYPALSKEPMYAYGPFTDDADSGAFMEELPAWLSPHRLIVTDPVAGMP